MDKFSLVQPTKEHERKAIDYIREFYEYNSPINGVGGLHRYLENYDGWLQKLTKDRTLIASDEKVPAETYFLVRECDQKIVGMINIRLELNDNLRRYGGHIGYSIRPTERQKGYNKINLYLGLCVCKKHGIKEVLMDCDKDNIASAKTMQSFGAVLVKEYYDDVNAHCTVQDYTIKVNEAIKNNKDKYAESVK